MKAVVAAFNQEKALVGAFSVITNLWRELFETLLVLSACRVLGWSPPVHQRLLEVQQEVVKDEVCIDGGLVGLGAAQQV